MKDNSIIKSSILSGIADGYRELAITDEEILFPQFKKKLFDLESTEKITNNDYSDTSDWERPDEYPDLSIIDISDIRNCFIMSVDNRDRKGFFNIKTMFSTATSAVAETGYIEDGVYTVIEENIKGSSGNTSNIYKTFNTTGKDYDHDYIVVKLEYPTTVTGFGFTGGTSGGITYDARTQPVVEVIAKGLDTTSAQVGQGYPLATSFTKKSTIIGFTEWTQLSSAFTGCTELVEIDYQDCSFEKITTFNMMFDRCISLKKIKGDLLNTNLPVCTNINAMFTLCYSLTELDINWILPKVLKSSSGLFNTTACPRLRKLKLALDFSENITSSANAVSLLGLANLKSLREVDLSGCKFGTFITSFGNMFSTMYELRKVNFENVDLSRITAASTMFNQCRRLQNVKGLNFTDTEGNSALTTMATMFGGCWCLEEIDIRGIPNVTTMASMANSCFSLKKVKMRDITSVLTTLNLKDIYSVEELDFEGCDLSGVTDTFATVFSPTTTCNFYNLHKMNITLSGIIDIKNARYLTEEEIQTIFTNLPDLAGKDSRTINISSLVKKLLTDEDIEIATNKNWVVTVS